MKKLLGLAVLLVFVRGAAAQQSLATFGAQVDSIDNALCFAGYGSYASTGVQHGGTGMSYAYKEPGTGVDMPPSVRGYTRITLFGIGIQNGNRGGTLTTLYKPDGSLTLTIGEQRDSTTINLMPGRSEAVQDVLAYVQAQPSGGYLEYGSIQVSQRQVGGVTQTVVEFFTNLRGNF